MRFNLRLVVPLIMICSTCLSGCWDAKEIQNVYYVVGAGLDYDQDKEEYVIYTQFIDFTSIASGEGKPAEEIPPWVGIGRGETVKMAMQNLYDEAQQQLFWGHISAVVLTENLLKQGVKNPIDAFIRHPESRYMPWIYGTKEDLLDIFNVTSVFNLSPLQTVLHDPYKTFRQKSMIKPFKMNQFLRLFQEPEYTVLLTNIELSDEILHQGKEAKELFSRNGAFLIQKEEYKGLLSQEDLLGYRWLQEETVRSPLLLRVGKDPSMVVMVSKPKYSILHEVEENKVKFNIKIHVQAHIKDVMQTLSPEEIKKKISENIEKEVRRTFNKGLELKTDVLHLRDEVYRNNVKLWKSQMENNEFELDKNLLKDIQVEVEINHSSKYHMHMNEIYYDEFMRRIEN